MGRLGLALLVMVGVMLSQAFAQTPRRVALVIGNGAYQDAAPLSNPVNDALDLASTLRGIGFQVVEGHDLAKRDLERAIGEFADALTGAEVGMFFYAGHGIQVDGRNFIVPVDARLDQAVKLRLEAVPIDEILDIMEQQTKVSLVFLDACRNNPFARGLGSGKRSAAPLGLAQFDATRGSFIAFSTAPGAVALDGTGRNSPFASALARHIGQPGQSINDLMIAVRRDVVEATGGAQRPWEQGSLLERFEFVPAAASSPPVEPRTVAPPPAPPQVASAQRSVGDPGAIEDMLRSRYLAPDPNGIADMVRDLYQDQASIYGARYGLDAIVKAKQDWFGLYSGWSLALLPGTLTVTPRGEDHADVVFDMSYDYVPKDKAVARQKGSARVTLGLVAVDKGWKIDSEMSEMIR